MDLQLRNIFSVPSEVESPSFRHVLTLIIQAWRSSVNVAVVEIFSYVVMLLTARPAYC